MTAAWDRRMRGPVIDLDAFTAANGEFKRRTGRMLTLGEYQSIVQDSSHPFFTVCMAAEFARLNAEAQADFDEYREEMSLGGAPYDPDDTPFQSSRGRKV